MRLLIRQLSCGTTLTEFGGFCFGRCFGHRGCWVSSSVPASRFQRGVGNNPAGTPLDGSDDGGSSVSATVERPGPLRPSVTTTPAPYIFWFQVPEINATVYTLDGTNAVADVLYRNEEFAVDYVGDGQTWTITPMVYATAPRQPSPSIPICRRGGVWKTWDQSCRVWLHRCPLVHEASSPSKAANASPTSLLPPPTALYVQQRAAGNRASACTRS